MDIEIRHIEKRDRVEISELIFHSLNSYYTSIGRGELMSGDPVDAASIFFDVYEDLDPGEGWVAVDVDTDHAVGVCFMHPRETHVSLGIMSVRSDCFGRGIAKRLLDAVAEFAEREMKSVRLVSSLFNLDSYSLYTRGGFAPFQTYQDVMISVPESGLPARDHNDESLVVRDATSADIESMGKVEMRVSGIARRWDYRYFIENTRGMWSVSLAERDGEPLGFVVSSGAQNFNMIGPGVAIDEDIAECLLHRELNRHRGRSPVVLIPVGCRSLVRAVYEWGGRNIEFHVAQSLGPARAPEGVTFPTFLPESG